MRDAVGGVALLSGHGGVGVVIVEGGALAGLAFFETAEGLTGATEPISAATVTLSCRALAVAILRAALAVRCCKPCP